MFEANSVNYIFWVVKCLLYMLQPTLNCEMSCLVHHVNFSVRHKNMSLYYSVYHIE